MLESLLIKFQAIGASFNKVAGLQATLLKETPTQVFPCEYCVIIKNTFLQNTSRRVLLKAESENISW